MPIAKIGSLDLHYEIHGQGHAAATPAVLIMGLATDAHGWERQLPALAAERRVLVFDNRGMGRSSKPPAPYTTAEMADDVAGLLDEVGFARAHVIGMSLGGMIAQEVALRHARRVRSLCLIATYGRSDAATKATADEGAAKVTGRGIDVGQMMAAMSSGGASAPQIDAKQVLAFLAPMVFTPKFLDEEKQFLRDFYARSLGYGFAPHGFGGQVAAALGHDTLARLATLGAPTLVVTGDKDKLIHARHSRTLAQTIPGARLVEIPGGTHGINFERAPELNEILVGWLRERDPN